MEESMVIIQSIAAAIIVICQFLMFFVDFWIVRPPVPEAAYWKIKHGVTKAEAVKIFGCKPHYAPGELPIEHFSTSSSSLKAEGEVWQGVGFRIYVRYDQAGNANGILTENYKSTLFEEFRRWPRKP